MRPEDEDDDPEGLILAFGIMALLSVGVWAFAIYGFMCRYIWVH